MMSDEPLRQLATFGGGCFWCTEAVFSQVHGVSSVVSGYAGGASDNPTYRQVCSGSTGHAEVIQVEFDPAQVSYQRLLEIFLRTHDPTTPNRQGHDVGTQYRSIVLYHDEAQRATAEQLIKQWNETGVFSAPIVTQVVPYTRFYAAEPEHQSYYEQHPWQPYCFTVISPKLEKFFEAFPEERR